MVCCAVLLPPCRFWGTPIPIWASEDGEEIRVIGSIQELSEVAGRPVSVAAAVGMVAFCAAAVQAGARCRTTVAALVSAAFRLTAEPGV
jgi:hypothetical protein